MSMMKERKGNNKNKQWKACSKRREIKLKWIQFQLPILIYISIPASLEILLFPIIKNIFVKIITTLVVISIHISK